MIHIYNITKNKSVLTITSLTKLRCVFCRTFHLNHLSTELITVVFFWCRHMLSFKNKFLFHFIAKCCRFWTSMTYICPQCMLFSNIVVALWNIFFSMFIFQSMKLEQLLIQNKDLLKTNQIKYVIICFMHVFMVLFTCCNWYCLKGCAWFATFFIVLVYFKVDINTSFYMNCVGTGNFEKKVHT